MSTITTPVSTLFSWETEDLEAISEYVVYGTCYKEVRRGLLPGAAGEALYWIQVLLNVGQGAHLNPEH